MGPPPLSRYANQLAAIVLGLLLVSQEVKGATNGGRSSSGSQQQQTPADFDCPEEFGYYAHPTDCTLYYVCVFGGALLESCTGGLMYSHELQTCDWPRNVGCAPGQQQQISQPQQQHHTQKVSQQPISQQVDTPTRGRQRQQQIQIPKADLYTEEEDLGPAEELESDRQQRVYRGQPSTLGQVASDRDGLTHTNAIPVPSTGGRDKLSVVSYGAQQQYNSKNERRQTEELENSDHNFLTNISRVRKKRDSTNSHRRSTGKKKKRSSHSTRKEGEKTRKGNKADQETSSSHKNTNATERIIVTDGSNEDYKEDKGEDEEGESSRGEDDSDEGKNNDEDDEGKDEEDDAKENEEEEDGKDEGKDTEDDEDEDYDDEAGDDEEDDEETDNVKNENDSKESSKSKESSDESLSDEEGEKNSTNVDDFKMEFPDPPATWESFEDYKFPYDEVDFDFDKFLEDLKSDKFDDFVLYGTDTPPSTTVYPTSIFDFGTSTYSPFLQSSTVLSGVKFDFYFPNFLSNSRNKQGKQKSNAQNLAENDYSSESRASARSDGILLLDSNPDITSAIESPLKNYQYFERTTPELAYKGMKLLNTSQPLKSDERKFDTSNTEIRDIERTQSRGTSAPHRKVTSTQNPGGSFRRTFSPYRLPDSSMRTAQDRSGNVESWNHQRNQFRHGKVPHILNRPHHPINQINNNRTSYEPSNNWNRNRGNFEQNGKDISYNSRGTAKYTLQTTPMGVSTTQKYPNGDTYQQRPEMKSQPTYRSRTTESTSVIQVTPKYNIQSTNPSIFDGNKDYRFTYSAHQDSSLERPKSLNDNRYKDLEFTTPKPGTLSQSMDDIKGPEIEYKKGLESNQVQQQRVISYSFPSVTFRESRGPLSHEKVHTRDGKLINSPYDTNSPMSHPQNMPDKSNINHSNHNRNYLRNQEQIRQNNVPFHRRQPIEHHRKRPTEQYQRKRPIDQHHRNQRPSVPMRQGGHRMNYNQQKHKNYPINFLQGGKNSVTNVPNHSLNEENKNFNRHNSFDKNRLYNNIASDVPNKSGESENNEHNYNDQSQNYFPELNKTANTYQQHNDYPHYETPSEITPLEGQVPQEPVSSQQPYYQNNYKPNSTVFVNNKLHSFSYVNIHDIGAAPSTEGPIQDIKATSGYLNHSPESHEPFRPSTWKDQYDESTPDYKEDSKEIMLKSNVTNAPTNSPSHTQLSNQSSTPPAGSYVYFTSNIGQSLPVPVNQNNLYENHKDDNSQNYNDYYNDYDEEDYEDVGNNTATPPKPPVIPKTLQDIDYQDYDDSDNEEYNDEYEDDNSEDEKTKEKIKASNSTREEYYDDEEEEEEDYEEAEPKREQSIDRPQTTIQDSTASSTMTNTECTSSGVTPQPGQSPTVCPPKLSTDRPTTTTADEQKNSEQTRRTITLLRASVQPVQQQAYDTRGYNSSRYIQQQQQYDPNYYAVYDEEAEQYKDIGDYAQYIQQNKQDVYTRKKPSVEIVQQEQLQRGSPYTKTKYSNQPENIYQSVTPQEYDSYSIQTNDDIPYRQVQTKTNNRGNSRHRGSLTYTVAPNEAESPQQQPRGTPPPQRGRPTLKPSTTVVGKAQEFVDIYRYPPSRPENVYPTPQVDKTAAKCRKDVCLLPDCYCGGKDVPGDLTPEETPQIVLLTFDDSVNDLNKGLYSDLFEKGRVNPNGCPISATFYVSHEWTDYSQVQNLYATGHEIASHSVSHSFGEQFSQKKWTREIAGQREILAAYGGVRLEDIRGMRAPFLAVGGNKMFKMLYDSNFTYDSSMPVYENRPPSWPYTLDYKIFHDCMIPPCPTKSYPGVWEVPMVMWQDLNGGRCSMGDACSNPPTSDGVYKMLIKNFERHFTTNRAPFGLFYHAAWFTQPHHKEGFIAFLDTINKMPEVWVITNWQAIQWVRDPTPLSRLGNFAPFQCNYPERPKKCNNPKVCNLWHKSGVRYMRTCQACPEIYPWTGKSGVRNSRIDNDLD